MKSNFEAKTASFEEVIGNGKFYKIPPFQRDYSWTKENWQDLWSDFITSEETKNIHYLGSVVFLPDRDEKDELSDNHFIVVDGQQRLTTLTIVIQAVINILQDLIAKEIDIAKNQERIDEIRRTYIVKKGISTLYPDSKLKLNDNNYDFFQNYILGNNQPVSLSKLNDSEKKIWDCLVFFKEEIQKKFQQSVVEMTKFLEHIVLKKMVFIAIYVDNEAEAYTIFETLNARGVELTTTDLLKNYLFSIASKKAPPSHQMKALESQWNKLVHKVGLNNFPKFLRYYINSKQKKVQQKELFRTIKGQINEASQVVNLITELDKKATLYNALQDPFDEFWNDFPEKNDINQALSSIKLFGVSQQIPLLFAVFDNIKEILPKILEDLVKLTFRYNVIADKNPNDLEDIYNEISQKIYSKEIKERKQILNILKRIYIEDDEFKQIFSKKQIIYSRNNKKIIKYILCKIERQITAVNIDSTDGKITIEHIIPNNYSNEYVQNFGPDIENFLSRLGNYTLLEYRFNIDCADKDYDFKKNIYKESAFHLARELCIKDDWDKDGLTQYQNQLANYACAVWQIQFA